MESNAIHTGGDIQLRLEELNVDGPAHVRSVRACHIQLGSGCVVTGTVTHTNSSVLRLHFVGSDQVLEPTALHPLFSLDRNGWVRAGDLAVDERLRTQSGSITVSAIKRQEGMYPVFNLTIGGAHTYIVSPLGLYSHNTCVVTPAGEAIDVPTGADTIGPTRAAGVMFTGGSGGPGLDARVTGVRIMEANGNQGPRAVYMNSSGQTVDPASGRTVSNSNPRAHHYLKPWP